VSKRFLLPAIVAALVAIGAFAAVAQAESGGSTEVTKAKPPAGVFKARIGWFYTDTGASDFPQSKVGPAVFHWASCAKAGGVQMAFPLKRHIYQGVNGAEFSTTKKTIALLSGPPLNPSDPFKAELYVGDLAKPGMTSLKVECIGRSHGTSGPLVTKMAGHLKTEYVRKDVNFKPANSISALNLLDLFGTEPVTQDVIVRSCSEPGTPSITLSSPALAAGPKGGAYVTLPANDELGTFEGLETPSKEAPPGEYEAVVSCGSGRVGVGVIGLH
jgi:hypothetical protein